MAYWVLKAILTPVLRLCYRVQVEGREHVPQRGPVILAANHRSFLDSIFLPLVLRRRVTFVAKAEYFDDPKTAWFFRAVGQIPIRREGGSASEGALAAATDVLERRRRVRHLSRGHAHARRLPAPRPHRCRAARAARPARRSSRSGSIGTDEVPADRQEAAAAVPHGVRSASASRSTARALRRPRARPARAARGHRRADVRDRRALRLRVRRHVRDEAARGDRQPARWSPGPARPHAASPADAGGQRLGLGRAPSRASARPRGATSRARRRRTRRASRARSSRPRSTRRRLRPGVAHTPSARPARYAAPSAVVSCTAAPAHGDAEQVGLELAEQVHHRSRRRRRAARRAACRVAAVIASTTSRVWYAIASTTARARCARPVPRVMPRIVPRAYGSHHGEPSPVNAGTNIHAAGVGDARGERAGLGRVGDDAEPVAQPLDRRAGDEDRALHRVRRVGVEPTCHATVVSSPSTGSGSVGPRFTSTNEPVP